MGLFDRFRGVARAGTKRTTQAELEERYAEKPGLRFLDAYVLDALGVLDDKTSDQLVELAPRIAETFGVESGPWQRVVELAFKLAPTARETIVNEWSYQLNEAVSEGARLNEVDFAHAIADSLAAEEPPEPLDVDLVVKPVEANPSMMQMLAEARQRAEKMGASAGPDELQRAFIEARNQWYQTPDDARPDPDTMIEALAVAAGEMVRAETDAQWVVYSYGDDAAEFALTDADHERLYKIVESVHERWMLWKDTGLDDYVHGTIHSFAKRLSQDSAVTPDSGPQSQADAP